MVDFDEHFSPIDDAAGLLAGVCGQLDTKSLLFPIGYDKWSKIPDSFFETQWNVLKVELFIFLIFSEFACVKKHNKLTLFFILF